MIDEKLKKELIEKGRRFMHGYHDDDVTADSDFNPSDQQLRLPQPPLCKAAMAEESAKIALPFESAKNQPIKKASSLIRVWVSEDYSTDCITIFGLLRLVLLN